MKNTDWETALEEKWDATFPARDGVFLKGNLPRFKSRREEIKSFIRSVLASERESFFKDGVMDERERVVKLCEELEQKSPMDIIDESLADIASDTKGEAWKLGYNTALKDIIHAITETK